MGNFVVDVCPRLRPFSYKQKGPLFQLSARVKFSDCLRDWRKLEKTCKIVLHTVGNFSFCIQHTHSNPSPTERESNFWKELQQRILKCYRRKRKPPSQTGCSFLFCSCKPTSLATTMRKTRVSASVRCSLPWNPWWLVHAGAHAAATNEWWGWRCSAYSCRVHIHDDRHSFFGDLYVSSEAWRALCGSRASQVRCVPLENGWDSYVMAPLIGQYSVSVTLLTNQLFVWVYLNSGPDITKRVPSSDREREELSIDVKHDSVRWNEKKLRTIKNVVSYGVLHHTCSAETLHAGVGLGLPRRFGSWAPCGTGQLTSVIYFLSNEHMTMPKTAVECHFLVKTQPYMLECQ